jgi:peptide/nickel transport system permease protein
MGIYVIRRLILAIVVLLIVTLMVFFVMRLLPGDPLVLYISDNADIDAMSPEAMAKLKAEFGLDKPTMVQYVNWVKGLTRLDFGKSIYWNVPVSQLLLERVPITLYLGAIATVLGLVLGVSLGILAAVRRGRMFDKVLLPFSYLGICFPVFWLGILLIYLFGIKLEWLPLAGFTSPFENLGLSLQQIVMPVICLTIFSVASNARQMRSSVLEVMQQDYIRTAWSKGFSERYIIIRHVLKNSLITIVTLIGMHMGHIFGGSVLVETVFAIPGMGRLAVQSIQGHDYIVTQGLTFVTAVTILVVNLLTDISYGYLDPRIRYH